MKFIILAVILLVGSGCSAMQPINMSAAQLQEQIKLGGIIQKGDTVKIVTLTGKSYEFQIKTISEELIIGRNVKIPIEDVATLDVSEFSLGETLGLVGIIWAILGIALSGMAVMPS